LFLRINIDAKHHSSGTGLFALKCDKTSDKNIVGSVGKHCGVQTLTCWQVKCCVS